jgi:hypothetical protein
MYNQDTQQTPTHQQTLTTLLIQQLKGKGRQIQIALAILWKLLHFIFHGWFQAGQVSLHVLHQEILIS